MIPQPMIPPPYYYDWYDPQNNPYWAYYYQGYDPNSFGYAPPNRSRSQTPQPSMTQSLPPAPPQPPQPNANVPYFYPYPPPPPFMWYPPYMGFRPISASRETTPCFSESERYHKSSTNDDRSRRAVSCTPTCCQHAKPFMVEENRNKFNTVEEPLINLNSQPLDDDERSLNPLDYDSSIRKSLKSVASVSNIHLLCEENGDQALDEIKSQPIVEEDEQSEDESESETTEVEEEISQDTATAELHYPHQLSVIYEENESVNNERRSSIVSRSSTLSDCSTTLMEEDNISVDYSADELDEENSNSVTVRLPLKFSFTRSKDNLVNTTLTVGNTESEIVENNSTKSKSPETYEPQLPPELPVTNRLSNDNSAPDVSVTFRLKSKSKSKTPERIITPTLSLLNNGIDSDPDCSVSISLPRKSISKESNCMKISPSNEEKSDGSAGNKNNIDSSLYTSLDALEEIKRGMAEITNSLCSKLCTLRKSALNIHSNDPYRSSSTSQIESIDTDSDNDLSLSIDDCQLDRKQSWQEEAILEETYEGDIGNEVKEETNDEDGVDFWSQISSANKTYEDEVPHLSKTSTRSSRYWFEDEEEMPEIQSIAYDTETNGYETEANGYDTETNGYETETNDDVEEEVKVDKKESNEVDFWNDYDEDIKAKFRASEYFNNQQPEPLPIANGFKEPFEDEQDEETEVEPEQEETEDEDEPVPVKKVSVGLLNKSTSNHKPKSELKRNTEDDEELASDEEWTEEEVEVTDDEAWMQMIKQGQQKSALPARALTPVPKPKFEVAQKTVEIETETEYEEEDEEPEEVKAPVKVQPIMQPTSKELEEESEEESEDDEPIPVSSSGKITKGKSLVNVSSFAAISNASKDKITTKVEMINEADDSDESEYSSAEESENEPALPAISSNRTLEHSNDDCQLTPNKPCQDDKVLMTLPLATIQSIDSKSNLTSESGISFEHNDSEDGYEEDYEEEASHDEKTVTKENDEDYEENDHKVIVNVRNKISMFERSMSEEPTEKSSKEVPRVQAKYSFKHRESSEPPLQKPAIMTNTAIPQRAVSEVKDVVKNQKLLDLINQRKSLPPMTENDEEQRRSVKERISSIEVESDASDKRETFKRYGNSKKSMPITRSIDESGEEDSGVTSDFCKQFSENETDTENFPELRKLSRYQRASTHSRLFKLLQGDDEVQENSEVFELKEAPKVETGPIPYKSKKIVHNVSVTRRQNPKAALEAETMEERRQRLCLPLSHQSSSGADSMSSSTTPSPTPGVNEKLVNELVQSLLSQKKGRAFKNLPIEKLHAAAVKILQEDMESNGTFSSADESTIPTVDSTPALTPQEFRNNSSYAEYYDSWDNNDNEKIQEDDFSDLNLIQSKAFKNLQEQQINASKKLWSVRCPRILSSKSINKDLARLSEVRESESPEPNHSRSPSIRSLSTEPMSGENVNIKERQMAKKCNT